MDVLFARGEATVNEVCRDLPDPPTTMAVRRLIHILEEKGHVKRRSDGRRVIYAPVRGRENAGKADLRRVLRTFFGGSLASALLAHFSDPEAELSDDELKRVRRAIRQARRQGD